MGARNDNPGGPRKRVNRPQLTLRDLLAMTKHRDSGKEFSAVWRNLHERAAARRQ
jgi:hypothetical protein